uniref:Uncharacterized protein n=1 Tax=Clastoptera arizonana TaxID=38151 RepID=A0A1B6CQH0_9HEMI
MWNIIKSVGSYFTNTVRDNYDDENRLSIILDGHDDVEPQNLITLDKTGKVTHINEVDGKIDGTIFFWKKEMPSDLKLNDLVSFTAYKETEGEEWRAKKIRVVHSESWEPEPNENELLDIFKTDDNTNRVIETTSYVENGQVLERQGRDVIISPGNIRCNLDVLRAEFLPRKGDFVQLYVTSTPNGTVTYDYLMPLRSRTKMGNITCWEKENNIGIISNEVVFHKDDCEPGYLPRIGDEVIADTIESEQGIKRWRALLVIPANLGDNDQSVDLQDSNSTLLQNKEGIYIPENTDIGSLKLGGEVVYQVVVENGGSKDHELLNASFCVKRNNTQITLEEPVIGEKPLALPSNGNATFVFRVKAKFCGKYRELFMWTFKGFEIARQLKFEVKPDKANNPFGLNQRQLKSTVNAEELLATSSGFVVAGIKPIKPSSFTPVSMGTFEVAHRLVHILLGENNNQQRQESEILSLLFKEYPYLKDDLAPHNYKQRMHTLLDLEEIKNMIDTSSYNLSHAVFSNVKDYLCLKIPNLAEKRPSLLVGDRVIIQESDLSQEAKSKDHEYGKYEGFIHKVQNDGILIKFGPFFHKSYKGDEYSVSFYASRTNFRRLHQAINVTEQHMGLDWLFPQILKMHPVQVKIKESADDKRKVSLKEKTKLCPSKDAAKIIWNTTAKIKDGKEEFVKIPLLSKYQPPKDIHWYNSRLNINQKRAVKYILRGDARPLPYVIFGPPGTGKTVTVVETILQLLAMVTDSRLLIATPSNSAADLIAERLIESDMFTSGMLLRLISHSYAEDKRLPQNIVPISAIVDIKSRDGTPYEMKTYNGAKMKVLSRQEIGLHRITIGTCTCVGALYTMGFPAGHFTHIIIDEAGQATEPELLIPLGFLNPEKG